MLLTIIILGILLIVAGYTAVDAREWADHHEREADAAWRAYGQVQRDLAAIRDNIGHERADRIVAEREAA